MWQQKRAEASPLRCMLLLLPKKSRASKRDGKLPQVTELISGETELFKLMLEVVSMHHMKLPS